MTLPRPPALAEALARSREAGRPLRAADWAGVLQTAEEAYAVQRWVGTALGGFTDAVPGHWKSGGPSREAALTHAPLLPAGVRSAPAELGDMVWHHRIVEAEVALRIGRDVEPALAAGLAPEHVDPLIDAMAVSVELCDSRWIEGAQAEPLLRLADFQSHGALVLGHWQPYVRRDWALQHCELRIGAHPPVIATGSHPLGDPAWLLPQWLRHVTRHGDTVPAGTVVTTGAWIIAPADAGDAVTVEFFDLGVVKLQF